ncbi:hypothetical protein B0T20DRAFT_186684 [Sordaria brevicollis]|uniref:Uncharacterized protein n=1 Tax=Sordaria brevicollis TaxID=83679 RepID=A0AAE0PFI2_SORBR|nr:hypothetical protein B0T20DRAFT_186684 [Sordaria brevicollis]
MTALLKGACSAFFRSWQLPSSEMKPLRGWPTRTSAMPWCWIAVPQCIRQSDIQLQNKCNLTSIPASLVFILDFPHGDDLPKSHVLARLWLLSGCHFHQMNGLPSAHNVSSLSPPFPSTTQYLIRYPSTAVGPMARCEHELSSSKADDGMSGRKHPTTIPKKRRVPSPLTKPSVPGMHSPYMIWMHWTAQVTMEFPFMQCPCRLFPLLVFCGYTAHFCSCCWFWLNRYRADNANLSLASFLVV